MSGTPPLGAAPTSLPARWVRRLVRLWRRSLQVRVVATTLLLGIVTVSIISIAMYRSIADGLVDDRVERSELLTRQLVGRAQELLDESDQTSTRNQLEGTVDIMVRQHLAAPPSDVSRYVIFTRSVKNQSPMVLDTIEGADAVDLGQVPDELRQAVAVAPETEHTTTIDLVRRRTSEDTLPGDEASATDTVPAVVVGAQLQVPGDAGPYDVYLVYPMDQEQRTLGTISRSFALGALSLILLVSAVAYVVTRQVVTPVRRAATVAERLSTGHLNERMSARGQDDLAQLGQAFNDMADSLQAQIRQLEGLSRVQQRFVSDVSHELRTPLTTITMASDVLLSVRDELDPVASRSAELLAAELERFEALLTDLLEISRHDAGAAVLDLEPVDLYAIVDRAIASARPIAEHHGSPVSVERHAPTAVAEVDSRRIERILRNLVVNALEHGEGRPVVVHVGEDPEAVAVVVEDRGVGLRSGEASLVFNRFWRADPARARTTGGTGLGLAISLEDARLHHGWLQAWGEPGQGSRFRLTLPKDPTTRLSAAPLPLTPLADPRGAARLMPGDPTGAAALSQGAHGTDGP